MAASLWSEHSPKHPKAASAGYLVMMLAATTLLFATVVIGIFVSLLMVTTLH